jgi:hypothetical protein
MEAGGEFRQVQVRVGVFQMEERDDHRGTEVERWICATLSGLSGWIQIPHRNKGSNESDEWVLQYRRNTAADKHMA